MYLFEHPPPEDAEVGAAVQLEILRMLDQSLWRTAVLKIYPLGA
jgi:hypothetical protein